jgi:hypothetical protein
MNARLRLAAGAQARLEIILRLVIAFVGQFASLEIKVSPLPYALAHRTRLLIISRNLKSFLFRRP